MEVTQHQLQSIHLQLLERLQVLLDSAHPSLRRDVLEGWDISQGIPSLEQMGEDGNLPSALNWAFSTVLLTHYLASNVDLSYASSIAIAVTCWMRALDLIDDLQDGEQTATIQSLGTSRVQSVALALQLLAAQAILAVDEQHATPEQKIRMSDVLLDSTLIAVGGQHLDILAEQQPFEVFALQECLEIVASKSGALLRMVFCLAALCANVPQDMYTSLADLGLYLGIYHQLMNDCSDFQRPDKTDRTRGKKTLPGVLASRHGDQEGLLAARAVVLLYRERAQQKLAAIEQIYARSFPLLLRRLLGITEF